MLNVQCCVVSGLKYSFSLLDSGCSSVAKYLPMSQGIRSDLQHHSGRRKLPGVSCSSCWCCMPAVDCAGQGSVADFRAAFTLEASLLWISWVTMGPNEFCLLWTRQVLTSSSVAGCPQTLWLVIIPCFQVPWVAHSQMIGPLSRWHLTIAVQDKGSDKMLSSPMLTGHTGGVTVPPNLLTELEACKNCGPILQLSLPIRFHQICLTYLMLCLWLPFLLWE
jgi:hypothetical protein